MRKQVLKFSWLLACLLFACQGVQAQSTREVWFRILQTEKHNDSIYALLDAEPGIGLKQGLLLKSFLSSKDEIPGVQNKRDQSENGAGQIYPDGENTWALIRLYDPADTLESGDLINVRMPVPDLPYRSIFSNLSMAGIIFTDAVREPLYSLSYLLKQDSRKLEDSLYAVLIASMQDAYQRVKDRPGLPAVLKEKVKSGRFKNRIPLEILRDATRHELESFLLYCQTYSVGYTGKNYRASESFMGWVSSNSPYSAAEVKRDLMPLFRNREQLLKRLPEYKTDMLSEHTANTLGADALQLATDRKFKEAMEMADFAVTIAELINDTVSKPTAYICKAQVYLEQDDYNSTISWTDKAIKAAAVSRNKSFELQGIIKKGYCLYKISKDKESEQQFRLAYQMIGNWRDSLSSSDYYDNLRKIYQYRSSISYRNGRYDEALALIDSAIAMNKAMNSYEAQLSNALFYAFMGKVNNDQGRPAEAVSNFYEAALLYWNNSNREEMARVQNDQALSYFKLGRYRDCIELTDINREILAEAGDYDNAGYARSLAGSAWYQLSQYDSAIQAHREAIKLREKGNNKTGQAFSWARLAELYKQSGSKTQALQYYEEALRLYQSVKDSLGMAEIFAAKGEVFLDDENYKTAIPLFEKANGISARSTVESLYNLGLAWSGIDSVKSRSYFSQCLTRSRQDGNTAYAFAALKSLARAAYMIQDTLKADQLMKEAGLLADSITTPAAVASMLALKGTRYEYISTLDSAIYYYQQAMRITDTADRSSSAYHLSNIAGIYISMGEFDKAGQFLDKGISLAREISDSLAMAGLMQFSSFLYSRTADYEKGMARNDSALKIFSSSGHRIRLANTWASRATLLSSMGENNLSIRAYQIADSIYKLESQEEARGSLFNNIGLVYISQRDYVTALKYLQQALAVLPPKKISESYLITQGNIAEARLGLKQYKEAKSILAENQPKAIQLGLNRVASGMALVSGKALLEESELEKSAQQFRYAYQYAIASGEKEKALEAQVYLGRIYSKEKKMEDAMAAFREATRVAATLKTSGSWEAFYETGLLYYNSGRFDSAIVSLKQAVKLLESDAGKLFGGEEARKLFNNDPRKSDLYTKLTFSYYNTGDINGAWNFANQSNIAGIRELSGAVNVNSSDAERNQALRNLLSLQESKKAMEQTLGKQEGEARIATQQKYEILEKEYQNFMEDLVSRYPDLGMYFSRSNADEFNKYKSKVPADMAVALYVQNDKTLMIFTLTREQLSVDTMQADLAARVQTFIELIKNTSKSAGTGALQLRSEPVDEDQSAVTGDFRDVSDELYQVLIGQVNKKLSGKKKLCIVPSGIFSNLPFQCLGRKQQGGSFRFLIEDYTLFYTNKISVVAEPEPAAPRNLSSFAAFGVPDATLRFNIAEVKEIGKMLGSDSTVYADQRATESLAKQSLLSKKYVHFATHGVLNYSTDYAASYLKLLPDKDSTSGNNGKLTMREVKSLGIGDCDMVILSACQTAVSRELAKGWNNSPANSFLISNVKTVVASLWKVADEPTSLLMQYFYENLKTMEKAEALRQAQVKLSMDPRFVHPNYWGAFVLYGDWR